MHNLVLDIGNTNSKIAVFKEDQLLHFQSLKSLEESELKNLIDKYAVKNSIVSNVGGDLQEIITFLKKHTTYFEFSTSVNTGVKNHYICQCIQKRISTLLTMISMIVYF